LIADGDLDARVLVDATGGFEVDTVDLAAFTEIAPPHAEAPATEDADLDEVHLAADELREVVLVDPRHRPSGRRSTPRARSPCSAAPRRRL